METRKERKLQRLNDYDYSRDNFYFVTICSYARENFFGEIKNGEMVLNELGKIVKDRWIWLEQQYDFVTLDEFVVMPNHFHGILIIDSGKRNSRACSVQEQGEDARIKYKENLEKSIKSLSQLIGAFKTLSSRDIHKLEITHNTVFKWHKSFYDRIIRNERELNNIRNYIKNNPIKWDIDIENSNLKIDDLKNNNYYEKIIKI